MSASTIMAISCSNVTDGFQPSSASALAGVADQVIDFRGPIEDAGSIRTYFCQSRPAWPNAVSTSVLTEWLTPVAMT